VALFDEGTAVFQNRTLINGVHETWPIVYAESAYGYAKVGQTIVNVPDGTLIQT
jgi:alpha,alpha-trehalose phosphorylase